MAINKAQVKEAVNSDIVPYCTFDVGKEYLASHNTSSSITITKRTPKTVTFINVVNGEVSPFGVSTKRVKIVNGSEYFADGMFYYSASQPEEAVKKAVKAVEPLLPQPTPTIEEVEGNSEPETVSVLEPELVEVLTEATIETIPENMQFTNYAEATQYIQNQVKSQGQKYYCTNEYKDIFPRLKQMAQEAKAKTNNHTVDMVSQAMSEAKVTWGDKVEWHNVGMLMSVTIVSGKIVNRKGIPFVQLDTPMNGKKSCKWHKGFMKVS